MFKRMLPKFNVKAKRVSVVIVIITCIHVRIFEYRIPFVNAYNAHINKAKNANSQKKCARAITKYVS